MRPAAIRHKNEADFHDCAYKEKLRSSASSFYALMDTCSRHYRQTLKTQCGGKRILEYGCGENSVAPFLLEHGAGSYVGIDISSIAVEQAERARSAKGYSPDRVRYHVMNAEALEFDANSFDVICGVAILHHLDLEKAYSEIVRTLRPGGVAIFLEPLAYNPFINLYRRLTPQLRTPDEHPLLMRDIKLAASRFGGIELRFYNLFTLFSLVCSGTKLFPVLHRWMDAIDRGVFAWCRPARRYAWTVSLVLTSPHKSAAPVALVANGGLPTEH